MRSSEYMYTTHTHTHTYSHTHTHSPPHTHTHTHTEVGSQAQTKGKETITIGLASQQVERSITPNGRILLIDSFTYPPSLMHFSMPSRP